ncbi:MAG: aminotransferase [Deltaproteobacteria bacterium]|nr:aminotransferase [Deltaproteobacteria bacterium]
MTAHPFSSTASSYDTAEVWRKDRDHFVHPWTNFASFEEKGSLVIAEAEGAYVFDSEGKRYLDAIGGLWCVNIGYGREEMAQTLANQARRLPFYNTFTDTTNVPASELAAKLAELAPSSLNHVFYGSGGSAANDTAVRIIHFYFNQLGKRDKKKIISRDRAYHGSTYLAMTLTGCKEDHTGFDLVPDLVHYVSAPDTYRRPNGTTLEEFCDLLVREFEDKILELGPENVAAFFAEPIMGAGGVLVPPPGYHRRTLEVCRRYGILYVSDEVVTGFGRLGHFFASEPVFDIEPDIITSAKGLTSGYAPLGATLLSDEIYEVLRVPQAPGAYFSHGFTYSGHALCCAAALTNIEIMEREEICGHVQELGPYFERQLATLRDLPLVGDTRGKDFMLCVENVADQATRELLPHEVAIGSRIADRCEELGVIVRPLGHLNVLSPPLILTREQVDEIVDVLRRAIESTQDDLVREGLWHG